MANQGEDLQQLEIGRRQVEWRIGSRQAEAEQEREVAN